MAESQFLERYHAGEHVPVWRELIDLGKLTREEPLLSEAVRVCEEIVRRARLNLRTLHTRLLDVGYEFADPDTALVDAGVGVASEIDQVEQELGSFPLVARVWYQTLSSVNFCQSDRQRVCRTGIRPPTGPDIFGLGSHPVLIFQSLSHSREERRHMAAEHAEHIRQIAASRYEMPCESATPGQLFPLGGWASNCEPKGFQLPSLGIDGVIYNDGGGDRYFVDELRLAFQWGGFPFWQWCLKNRNFYSPMEYRPNFEKLLPLLKEGLLEL
jgi:hypothetical protein